MWTDGDVVKYKPRQDWCHHGIAIVRIPENGQTYATDTYWGERPTDNSYVDIGELDPANIIGNTHTFGKVPYPHEYYDFNDADKYWIPMGGGSAYERVRIGAAPNVELKTARLKYEVEKAAAKIQSAEGNLRWAQKQLDEYLESMSAKETTHV
jgi:hypothetical protein